MALWTRDTVRAVAPEFTPTPDATIDFWITVADGQIAEQNWGDRAQIAGAYLTAHLMVLSKIGPYADTGSGGAGVTGAIKSIAVGQVSVSYDSAGSSGGGSGSASEEALKLSRYGLEYLRLVELGVFGLQVL